MYKWTTVYIHCKHTHTHTHTEASTEADLKRLKLWYQDPRINVDDVGKKWAELLSRPHPPDQSELRPLLIEGIYSCMYMYIQVYIYKFHLCVCMCVCFDRSDTSQKRGSVVSSNPALSGQAPSHTCNYTHTHSIRTLSEDHRL